jgi:predicted metal-dependent peptidase
MNSFKNGLTAKEKIVNAQDYLWDEHPIGIPFLSKWKIIEDDSISTACTNGATLRYSPDWIGKLPSQVVKGIMLHEVAHVLFAHHLRRGDRDPRLWNIAADLAINSHLEPWYSKLGILSDLKKDGVASGVFPLEGNYVKMPSGKNAEWYYHELINQINNQPEEEEDEEELEIEAYDFDAPEDQGQQGEPESNTPAESSDLDDADVNRCSAQGDEEGEQDSNQSNETEDKFQELVKQFLGDDYDKEGMGDISDAPETDEQDIKEIEEAWKDTLSEAVVLQKKQGEGFGDGLSILECINKRANNGWSMLRQWITKMSVGGYTWKRPSRRHGYRKDVILPSNRTKNKTNGVVIVDTSGSMGDLECAEAIVQIDKIIREYRNATVTLVQCDTRVIESGTRTFTKADFPLRIPNEWYGRGGTDMIPSINWVKERSSQYDWCLIVSDMYWEIMYDPDRVPHAGVPTVYVGINTSPDMEIKPNAPQTHYIAVEVAA